jgi:CHRD domain
MMNDTSMKRLKVVAIVLALASAALASSIIAMQQPQQQQLPAAFAQQQSSQTFTAKLSGKDEVPPVNTQASGMATFQPSSDGKEVNYDLSTSNLQGFMMAHIHQGKAGENGQPVAGLQMGKGKITSSDLQGPLAGKQISDLVNLMKSGGAYTNVHTQQNQNGEIRGQISG